MLEWDLSRLGLVILALRQAFDRKCVSLPKTLTIVWVLMAFEEMHMVPGTGVMRVLGRYSMHLECYRPDWWRTRWATFTFAAVLADWRYRRGPGIGFWIRFLGWGGAEAFQCFLGFPGSLPRRFAAWFRCDKGRCYHCRCERSKFPSANRDTGDDEGHRF
jgi:hypothetical protein